MENATNATYAEAWQALMEGKDVFFEGKKCKFSNTMGKYPFIVHEHRIRNGGTRTDWYQCPTHPTETFFKVVDDQTFTSLGLSDDCVNIEVFGIKLYQIKGTSKVYRVNSAGSVYDDRTDWHGKVKYKGDHGRARVKVTVNTDGDVLYEDH